jgi:(1->4)-alpha-D-glucan 1-alpha-D-glucosylmutase
VARRSRHLHADAELFRTGEYVPLAASGKRAANVFAFARRNADGWALVVVPRLVSRLATVLRFPTGITAWRDTQLAMPEGSPARWKNVLTGGRVSAVGSALPLYRLLEQFPVGLLVSK